MAAELRTSASRRGQSAKGHAEEGAIAVESSGQPAHEEGHAVVLPTPVAERTGWKLARMAYWTLQIALAVGLGYWIATTRATHDTRIDLPTTEAVSRGNPAAVAITTAIDD